MNTSAASALWPPETTLELDGIRLQPLALTHEAGVAAAAADGELWNLRYTSVPEPQETRAYIETAIKQRAEGIRLAFAVIDIASSKVIGSTSYHDIVPAIKRLEIGWTWYAKSYQRSKVNTLCKLMLMQHAFDTLGCDVVGWRASHMNLASQRAIERLGAKRDGVLRHHAPIRDGKVRDTVMYSLLAAEWPAAKQKLEASLANTHASSTSRSTKVTLQQITSDTLRSVLKLNPGAVGERMVATNAWSIAQSAYSANAVPCAIMAGDLPVGFIMMYDTTIDPALAVKDEVHAGSVDIWRLMIDFQQQGKGYGEAAILEAARYAATRPGVAQIRLSYVPVEGNPSPFYTRMGFVETGERDGIEIVMAQPLAELVKRLSASQSNGPSC